MKRRPAQRPRLLVEELERRILFSADAAALLGLSGAVQGVEVRLLEPVTTAPAAASAATTTLQSSAHEIVFVDSRVPDAMKLVDDLMQQRGGDRVFDIVVLQADEDGIAQINRILANEHDLAAIHIISHGSDGAIEIGSAHFDAARLAIDAESVARWGQALAAGGDLLLYGCDVAQDAAGQGFVQNLARLTGADVAASKDATGSTTLGGNWSLEYMTGRIEASVAPSATVREGWTGLLANSAPVAVNDNYTVAEDGTLTANWFDTAWAARRTLTFNNSAQSQTLVDFPVLVVLNSGNIDYAKTQNNGADLRFFAADGTPLAYDIEAWNEAGDSFVWVKVPQITGGSVTDAITMYYGNAAAQAGANPEAVWGGTYRAVQHMDSALVDATVNNNDGVNAGAATTPGKVGQAQLFDGLNSDINLGSAASVDNVFATGGTVSAWINPSAWGENAFGRIFDKSNATLPTGGWALELSQSTSSLLFQQGFSTGLGSWWSASGTISLGTWQQVTVTYDSSSAGNVPVFYVNGVQVGTSVNSTPVGTAVSDAALDLHVGNFSLATSRTFAGAIDEVSISGAVRSADWIHAQYLSSTNAFVSFGGEVTAPTTSGVVANDSDVDGNPLTVTLVSGPSSASAFSLKKDGTFSYTPAGNFYGTDSFTYRVNDGTVDSNIATATITVAPVADTPSVTGTTTNEDTQTTSGLVITRNAADGAEVGYFQITGITNGTLYQNNGTTAIAAGDFITAAQGSAGLKFTPAANFNGNASFTVQASTSNTAGGLGGSTVNATVTVNPVADAPVAVNDAYSVNEDSTLVVGPSTANLADWWGFNEGGSTQTIASAGSLSNSATLGSTTGLDANDPTWTTGYVGGSALSFNGAGQYVNTASTDLKTASNFTLSAWFQTNTTTGAQHILWEGYPGGNGYGNGGSTTSATSEMSLSIGSYIAAYDNKIVFSLGYDIPANGADSIFIASASNFTDTGSWHQVAVTVTDIGGGVMSASLYVDGKLEGTDTGSQNDRSTWGALRIGAPGDGSRSFNGKIDDVRVYSSALSAASVQGIATAGVLGNDSDLDSAMLKVNTSVVTGPANGTLSINSDGSFAYTPNANFYGTDSFTYKANDGALDSNVATATITVNAVNDAPVLSGGNGLVAISENPASNPGTLVSALIGGHVSDVDSGALTGIAVTAVDNSHGNWQYTTDGGTTWLAFGTPSAASSRLLAADSNTFVRFVPDTGWSGVVGNGITFRAWDQTGGSAGASADTSVNGGTTAFSLATASVGITVNATGSITGTVYEDLNGDSNLADAVGAANVTVRLYRDDGSGTPDAADNLVATTVTAAGSYSFSGLADATYWVVVDSRTITPSAGFNAGFAAGDVWAEQTYGTAGSVGFSGGAYTFSAAAGSLFGGMRAGVSDDAAALATSEHVTRAVTAGSTITGVNSGFSFNVVTNVRGGDTTDDDPAANRTVQGSLAQFIQNANAVSGGNVMRFVPTTATNATDGTGNTWWRLDVTKILPSLTDPGTTLDGTAYSANNGTTVRDTNAGQLGTGGTVGVDGLTLDRVNRPELEVAGSALNAPGITVDAASATIRNLALDGFTPNGGGAIYAGAQLRITSAATNAGGGVLVSGNLIGMHADGTNPGTAQIYGINIDGAATVTNNFIAFVTGNGVMLSDAWMAQPNTQSVTFADNEMAYIGDPAGGTGDTLSDISNGAVIRGNYLHDFIGNQPARPYSGKGIEVWYQTQNALIEDNTIANMRTAGIGINDGSQNNIIRRNIITGTTGDGTHGGAGILITSFNDTAASPPSGNQISENSIYGNAGLAIDIDPGTVTASAYGNGVTANDAGDADTGGNNLQNFPLLGAAATTGSQITITGSLNSTANSYFRIEFFSNVTADGSGYGEGQRYLGFANVTTDAAGNATISATLPAAVAVGEYISATATKSNATFTTFADTSEFAQDVAATAALSATNLSAVETYTEDAALNLTDIVVGTTSATATATLTLSNVAAGGLNTGTSGAVTSTYSAATGVWTASGAVANVNTLLAGLTFTPSPNFNGNFTIATNVSDGVATPITGMKAMTGTAVNDTPVQVFTGTNFTGAYAYNDFSGNWFVQNTPFNTGTIQSQPQGAVLHLSDSAGGSSSSGVIVYFDGSLKLGDLQGGSFASTGNALAMNIYLDTGNDGQFFSFSGTQYTGLNGDSYGTVTLGANGGAFNGNTVFTKSGGIAALPSTFTLAQLMSGAVTGIDANTRVALWIGGGGAFSSDISNISVAASTAGSLTVQEDSGLTSLGLGGLTFGPGGGADEAGQTLSYTVTAVPGAALGNVVLADGSTVVSANTSYTLGEIQGMQFRTTANGNGGGGTFSFSVKDSGGTLNGGVDTLTKSLTLNVTAVNDAPVAAGSATLGAINEDTASPPGASVSSLFGATFSDSADQVTGGSSANTFAGIAISSYTVDASKGNWQYSTNTGSTWTTLGSATTTAAITLDAAASTLLRFVPAANYNGAATALAANLIESGQAVNNGATLNLTGATGAATHVSAATVALGETITTVNDAPTATNLSAAQTYTEDTPLALTAIVASDIDSASVTATLTLSNAAAGSLNTATSGAVTSTYNAGTGAWSASGAIADVNTLLAGLTFTPTANFNGNFTITTSISDGSLSVAGSKAMTGTAVNDAPTGSVTISGTATQGQTLTASNTLADADGLGTIGYQWQAAGVNIGGATGTSYVLTEAEVGKTITVVASYTDGHGTNEAVSSTPTAAVANVNDAPTGSVTISGTPTQGQTLTAGNTLADADGLGTIGYQWQAGGSNISGATGTSYVLTEAEVGKTITVVASYTDGHGTNESVASATTAAVVNVNDAPTGSVTISGTATQGQTLTAGNTLADGDGLGTIGYQWQAGGSNISGATGTSYVLTEAEVGKTITVVASYTDGHGTNEAVSSTPTAAVANVNDAPTGSVTISGTATQGQTLTASNTLADADGLGTIGYQWQAAGVNIGGATGTSYVLTEAEVGKTITVVASYTDGHGTNEAVSSTPTAAVANDNAAPTASNLGVAETYTKDTPLNLADIVISDVDSANVTVTLTLSDAAAGSLSTATSGAVTSTYDAGAGVWRASGPIADVNALLAGLTFTPTANSNRSFSITTGVSDGVAAAVTGSKAMTSAPVNAVPLVTTVNLSLQADQLLIPSAAQRTASVVDTPASMPAYGVGNVGGSQSEHGAAPGVSVTQLTRSEAASSVLGLDVVPAARSSTVAVAVPAPSLERETHAPRQLLSKSLFDLDLSIAADTYLLRVAFVPVEGVVPGANYSLRSKQPVGTAHDAVRATDEDGASSPLIVQATQATGVALAVGTVVWALRAGGLLASLAGSLPAWRHFDLLAVLPDEKEDDDWDEDASDEDLREELAVGEVLEPASEDDAS